MNITGLAPLLDSCLTTQQGKTVVYNPQTKYFRFEDEKPVVAKPWTKSLGSIAQALNAQLTLWKAGPLTPFNYLNLYRNVKELNSKITAYNQALANTTQSILMRALVCCHQESGIPNIDDDFREVRKAAGLNPQTNSAEQNSAWMKMFAEEPHHIEEHMQDVKTLLQEGCIKHRGQLISNDKTSWFKIATALASIEGALELFFSDLIHDPECHPLLTDLLKHLEQNEKLAQKSVAVSAKMFHVLSGTQHSKLTVDHLRGFQSIVAALRYKMEIPEVIDQLCTEAIAVDLLECVADNRMENEVQKLLSKQPSISKTVLECSPLPNVLTNLIEQYCGEPLFAQFLSEAFLRTFPNFSDRYKTRGVDALDIILHHSVDVTAEYHPETEVWLDLFQPSSNRYSVLDFLAHQKKVGAYGRRLANYCKEHGADPVESVFVYSINE